MFRQIKNSKSKGSMGGGEFIFCVGNAHLGQGVCFLFSLFLLLLLLTCFFLLYYENCSNDNNVLFLLSLSLWKRMQDNG